VAILVKEGSTSLKRWQQAELGVVVELWVDGVSVGGGRQQVGEALWETRLVELFQEEASLGPGVLGNVAVVEDLWR
jgi:hypothetical protein